ncbi:MAG: alcohol dehydrogenase catalytic domain-containing protein, partial [Sedimentisphaerales bacterium]|nr:alcohol dehydrogenase catalytic domain-containing protein [Sedimentisphaerales bacterium]
MSKYTDYFSTNDFSIPKTMLALVATGAGFENLALTEIPVPEIGSDQLLARVDAAGVCTSILKLIDQGKKHTFINGWDMKKWPVILGDEGSVTLAKIGDNLKDKYKIGQRYVIQPAVDIAPLLHRERYKNNAEGMYKCAVGYTLGGHLAQYIRIQEEVLKGQ